jgi:hypothetical protein
MGVDYSHHGGTAFPGLETLYGRYEGSIKGGQEFEHANGNSDAALKDKVGNCKQVFQKWPCQCIVQ